MKKTLILCGATAIALALSGCLDTPKAPSSANAPAEANASTTANGNSEAPSAAPDITTTDYQGQPFSLSDYRGKKYVVLDFWGTWCYWCMKGIPDMKAYYDKYRDKVEFVGINCGDTQQDFLKAVKEKGLNWRHIVNSEKDGFDALYRVEAFPTKVIIDPEGNIVETVEGEDPAFYKKLEKLLQ